MRYFRRWLTGMTAALCAVALAAAGAQTASVQVVNPDKFARPNEVVDLPLAEVSHALHAGADVAIAAHLHGSSQELLTQRYASQVDGQPDRLLVLVDLAPRQKVILDLAVEGTPREQKSRVQARQVPERMDDFAWENDVAAYRVYGPALEATGEIASGIDVWSKRVPDFVTESWYARDRESARTRNPALSYHKDNGQGLDSYEVGPSRGCGGTAVYVEGKLVPSKNVASSRILANGPVRVDFVFEYAPWQAGAATVRETKRITLDAGSKLNHIRSSFQFDGPALSVAAGVAMHQGAVLHQPGPGIASVWDTPQLASAGRIGTAVVLPPGVKPHFLALPREGKVAGNAVFLFDINGGEGIDYYAGSAWSQADMPQQEQFDAYLKNAQERVARPVTYRWVR